MKTISKKSVRVTKQVQYQAPANIHTSPKGDSEVSQKRIFLLSPANASGRRAEMLLNENADFELAQRLRGDGAPLGEVFSFMSSLYFRGKLIYAQTFSSVTPGLPGVLIITPSEGLLPPHTLINRDALRDMSRCNVDPKNPRYRLPLERTASAIQQRLSRCDEIVLLGSIASPKYVEPLVPIFGEQLLFPAEFVGRGDMSRGGLLLRHSQGSEELRYASVSKSVLHGRRPPKLKNVRRKA